MNFYLTNLTAWWVQVAIVGGTGALLPTLFHLKAPRARLWYWRVLLMLCLALPLLQPWIKPFPIASDITFTMGQFRTAQAAQNADFSVSWTFIAFTIVVIGTVLRLLWLTTGLVRLRRYRRCAPMAQERTRTCVLRGSGPSRRPD